MDKELEELKKENKILKEEYVMLQNASDSVEEDLQQRIDKAIEYIKHNITKISKEEYELWLICEEVDHLLEILGDSNE